jgi:hypothetical protein
MQLKWVSIPKRSAIIGKDGTRAEIELPVLYEKGTILSGPPKQRINLEDKPMNATNSL